MISTPMSGPHARANSSSTPVVPPEAPCIARKVAVAANHPMSRPSACPNGRSSDWSAPAPYPSSEIAKLWTLTIDMALLSCFRR
jgi:hypothetical protein